MYSDGVGSLISRRAAAKIGDVGMASGAEASTWVSCDIVSSWRLVSGWGSVDSSSTSGSGSEAAMESIVASANAGTATTESSWSKADETIMTPFLSYLNFFGIAPTDTESYADIWINSTTSSAAFERAKVALNPRPLSRSTSSLTMPMGRPSWFSRSRAGFASKSKAPRLNMTFSPPETVATVSHGTAMPVMVRGASSPAAASRVTGTAVNLIMKESPRGLGLVVQHKLHSCLQRQEVRRCQSRQSVRDLSRHSC